MAAQSDPLKLLRPNSRNTERKDKFGTMGEKLAGRLSHLVEFSGHFLRVELL